MIDFLSRFNPGEVIGLAAIVGGGLCAIFAIIANYWHESRKAELAANLKQDMLNRGMSAEEIKTVLEAGNPRFSFGRLHCQA